MTNGARKSLVGEDTVSRQRPTWWSEVAATFCCDLLCHLLFDITLLCDSDLREASKDAQTIAKRVQCEGFGFLSKCLPQLGKAIDRSLSTGVLAVPPVFRRGRDSSLPVLFRGILRRIYTEDGCLRPDNSDYRQVEGLRGLRQICYLFYKVEVQFHDSVIAESLKTFRDTDRGLPSQVRLTEVIQGAADLLCELLRHFDPREIEPRHGPGSVATGETLSDKWCFKRRYKSAEAVYPAKDYLTIGGPREIMDSLDWYRSLDDQAEPTAKIVAVPKDSRGPRLISMEPLELQFLQQGLGRALMDYVENHPLTRGFVNFTHQCVNQQLAIQSSIFGDWATVDLKDASDRVSMALVRAIFPDHVLEALEATRSTATITPEGDEVSLKKFAPMGSALCFPVEALTFWALTKSWLQLRRRQAVRPDSLEHPTVHARETTMEVVVSHLLPPPTNGIGGVITRTYSVGNIVRNHPLNEDGNDVKWSSFDFREANPATDGNGRPTVKPMVCSCQKRADGETVFGEDFESRKWVLEAASEAIRRTSASGSVIRSRETVGTDIRFPQGIVGLFRERHVLGHAFCSDLPSGFRIAASGVIRRARDDGSHAGTVLQYPRQEPRESVFVYGDDIVIPVDVAAEYPRMLQAFGLVVNEEKSYWTGHFRESCGVDMYGGRDVTPVKLRHPIWNLDIGRDDRSGRDNVSSVLFAHGVSFVNSLYARGYWKAMEFVRSYLERGRALPYGTSKSGYPCIQLESALEACFLNRKLRRTTARWDRHRQRWEHRVMVVKTRSHSDEAFDGWPRLMRGVLQPPKPGKELTWDFPRRVHLTWRWSPV